MSTIISDRLGVITSFGQPIDLTAIGMIGNLGTVGQTLVVRSDGRGLEWGTGSSPGAQSANTVYAGPTSGGAAVPTFRALVHADLAAGGGGSTKFLREDMSWSTVPTSGSSGGGAIPVDGWVAASETWTYASADDPTFTFTITGDYSTTYFPGQRLKLTQTTVKYFIVTAVAYSAPNTTVTIYGGTDYDLANAAISSTFYSPVKAPAGFPLDPLKWTHEFSDTSSRIQSSPVQNTWYNPGTMSIAIPIGAWHVSYRVALDIYSQNQIATASSVSLSTSGSTPSDDDWTIFQQFYIDDAVTHDPNLIFTVRMEKDITLAVKTTYYLICRTTAASVSRVGFENTVAKLVIRAASAYL